MTNNHQPVDLTALAAGAVAGLAGTFAMMAMRTFDQKYAPKTIPQVEEDPGAFLVKQAEHMTHLAGAVPKPLENISAKTLHLSYGTIAGVLYAAIRGRRRRGSSLLEGGLLGGSVYAVGYAGWLPLARLTRPLWKQTFPQIAGEALRQMAFGVTTAAVYGAMNAARD